MHTLSRRAFTKTAGLSLASLAFTAPSFSTAPDRTRIKAIAFDGFPIFDPRPVFKKVAELFPEKGNQLTEVWRAKQFSYQWLRAVGNKYKNFQDVTEDALVAAAAACDITLSSANITTIMQEYRSINVWPDVKPALQQLKAQGLKLCFLTNMTEEMIRHGLQNSDITEYFDLVLSTDRIKTYKPDPAAYQLGVDSLNLKKEEILFAAFAGWDVAGAKWFGYPTYWVNRLSSPMEELDATPDGTGKNLTELLEFVRTYNA